MITQNIFSVHLLTGDLINVEQSIKLLSPIHHVQIVKLDSSNAPLRYLLSNIHTCNRLSGLLIKQCSHRACMNPDLIGKELS